MDPLRSELKHIVLTDAERAAIQRQLERMLSNPLFKNSRRYPALLRYVVEHTLEGRTSELKERTLGIEVFGREPDYDTNADPIVRATAGEIRKRIAQYYHEHGHESEVRIDLTPRSYVPEFEIPAAIPAVLPVPLVPISSPRRFRYRWVTMGAALVATCVVAALWLKPWAPETSLDRFWRPVLDSSSTVLLCVGQREFLGSSPEAGQTIDEDLPKTTGSPVTLFQLYYLGSQNIALSDARTLGRLTGLLQAKIGIVGMSNSYWRRR
jgi:hypothetical protein